MRSYLLENESTQLASLDLRRHDQLPPGGFRHLSRLAEQQDSHARVALLGVLKEAG